MTPPRSQVRAVAEESESPAGDPTPARAADSIAAQIKNARDARRAHDSILLPLPGYEGEFLRARFGAVADRQWRSIQTRMTAILTGLGKQTESMDEVNADLLIAACREIVYVDPKTKDETTIEDALADGLGPVCFDQRLAEFMELPAKGTARDVLYEAMAVPQPEAAIGALAGEVTSWLNGTSDAALDEALGE